MAQPSNLIEFGRDVCGDFSTASRKEWLITNGIGGFASGTVAGVRTRRYHGLLIAALHPPLGRVMLVSQLDEVLNHDGQIYHLSADHLASGAIQPQGYLNIERFYLDGSIPVWEFAVGNALLEKRIWMQPGQNTTYIRYTSLRAESQPIQLTAFVHVNPRDYHGLTHASQDPSIHIDLVPHGLYLRSLESPSDFYVYGEDATIEIRQEWHLNHYLAEEAKRGEGAIEDSLTAGTFRAELLAGGTLTIVASTQRDPCMDAKIVLAERQAYEEDLLAHANRILTGGSPNAAALEQLVIAADQFISSRPSDVDPEGKTILAGFPWFSDWGRDAMISLPGLTLATGRPEIARSILRTFARYIDQGMLPNRFPDRGETPEYNTADATFWFFEAIRAYLAETDDLNLLVEIYPLLQDIINWHLRGTRYQIHCDPSDGLIFAGEPTTQLTWMDVKIDGWAVTPRSGKPVEINALWYNALRSMFEFAVKLKSDSARYANLADRALAGFARFWNPQRNCLFDVLDGPEGNDASMRPNQIIAAGIHYTPLSIEQQKEVVDVCARNLLISFGLRSLGADEPGYIGKYHGDRWQRDIAYHQGTTWGWLIGPFISAYLQVYHNHTQAWRYLQPFFNHLSDHGLGSISEIFGGDPPFIPGGCIAQAWSVAEVLRVIREIQTMP